MVLARSSNTDAVPEAQTELANNIIEQDVRPWTP
jgi:hypothetical protein